MGFGAWIGFNLRFNYSASFVDGWWEYDNDDIILQQLGKWNLNVKCIDNASGYSIGKADWDVSSLSIDISFYDSEEYDHKARWPTSNESAIFISVDLRDDHSNIIEYGRLEIPN